jgi:hypothetical protein
LEENVPSGDLSRYEELRAQRGVLRAVGVFRARQLDFAGEELRQAEGKGEFARAAWIAAAWEYAREEDAAVRDALEQLDRELKRVTFAVQPVPGGRAGAVEEEAFTRTMLDLDARRVTQDRLLAELVEELRGE